MPMRTFHTRSTLALLIAGAAAVHTATAVDAQIPAPPQARAVALVGGTIHTVSGDVIENGTLVFDNGVIIGLGPAAAIPDGAERVDITGRHVYPGLIHAHSQMGLYEIGAVDMTVDLNELGPFNPNARARVAFNPESRHIGVARSNGVLVTVSAPAGGIIAGLSAAMMMEGWTWEGMTLRAETGLIIQWPSPSQEGPYDEATRSLRAFFADARAYRDARQAAPTRHPEDARLEAMIPALERTIPVVVQASELRQIQDAIAWADEERVRIVLLGGHDAGYVADLLARRQIPVIVTTVLDAPSRAWEPYDTRYSLPARLHQAGVPFAIAGAASAPYANRLPYEAGAATAFGLPPAEALRAVTLYPARILGLDDRIGSLEIGKDATLMVTSGDPLQYQTAIEQAYIHGRRLDMADAHRRFFEKYSERIRQEGARLNTGSP